jgi:hypothetical protein
MATTGLPFLPAETVINSSDIGAATNGSQAPVRDEQLAMIEVAVQGVILFLAVFGNGLVLLVLGIRRKKLSRMNLMIVHLSIADLFVAFFNVLPQLIWDITERFYGGDFLCRSVKYLQVVAMYASSFVLVSTALDRWLVICHPLKSHTWSIKKLHGLVGIAWLLSLVFSVPQITIFAFREEIPGSGLYNCWGVFSPDWTMQLYITWITLAIYIVPLILLATFYGRICFAVWGSMQAKEPSQKRKVPENGSLLSKASSSLHSSKHNNGSMQAHSNPRAHVRGVSRAKVKTVKLTLTVIVCYILCWGPFFIAQMWAAWDPNAPFQGKWPSLPLFCLHSCIHATVM